MTSNEVATMGDGTAGPQFDISGTGIPTAENTHQVAQAIAPESRVVYVDYDPIVLSHARDLLVSQSEGATDYIDADPHAIVATLMDAVPAGSLDRDTVDGLTDVTDRMVQQDFTFRSREQVERFFDGTDLVASGLVPYGEWRPDAENPAVKSAGWCAVGRKREGHRDDQ